MPPPNPNPPVKLPCAAISKIADLSLFSSINHYWQNWPKNHVYVASRMCFPTNVEEVGAAVRLAESNQLPVRAVGGGWSFSDASLPGDSLTIRADVDTADKLTHSLPLAEGFPAIGPSVAIINPADGTLIGYNEQGSPAPGFAVNGSAVLDVLLNPAQLQPACLINTRSLKSSLQAQLSGILSANAKPAQKGAHYFHVEGGITIEELSALLDAQSPRMVLEASGGNPGATLAGSISTGTHGAEFNTDLLVDRVKAIHLVGPGGLQWWIEGTDPIADIDALLARYPCLDRSRVITTGPPIVANNGSALFPDARAQDWLNAVVVSMGCIGVIYSIVLEVSELTGMRQVVSQTTWWQVLANAIGEPLPAPPQGVGIAAEAQLRIPRAFSQ